jgi:hypothetical protein
MFAREILEGFGLSSEIRSGGTGPTASWRALAGDLRLLPSPLAMPFIQLRMPARQVLTGIPGW